MDDVNSRNRFIQGCKLRDRRIDLEQIATGIGVRAVKIELLCREAHKGMSRKSKGKGRGTRICKVGEQKDKENIN